MLLNVNKANIAQAKATVRTFGVVYLHGCGNMYHKEGDSDFRKNFSNVNKDSTPSPSTYVIKFTNVNQIPNDVEELVQLFLKTKNQELRDAAVPKSVSSVTTVKVTAEDSDGLGEMPDNFVNQYMDRTDSRKAEVNKSKAVDGSAFNAEKEELAESLKDSAELHQAKDQRIADLEARLAALAGNPAGASGTGNSPAAAGGTDDKTEDNRTPAQKRLDTIAANKAKEEGPKTNGTGVEI